MAVGFESDTGVRDALRKPFPPEQVGKLPKPTKKENPKGKCKDCGGWHGLPAVHLDYVGHAAVTDRLNRHAPGWSYTIDEVFNMNGKCWVRGTMTLDGISRPEFGDGTDPKEAVSNFIRRAAMRFGVALDLWSKEELQASAASAQAAVRGSEEVREAPPSTPSDVKASGLNGEGVPASLQPVKGGPAELESADGSPFATSSEEAALWASLVEITGTPVRALARLNAVMPSGGRFTKTDLPEATAEQIGAAIEALEGASA